MQQAIEEAMSGIKDAHGGPFGAVVVKNGEIIGRGHNCVLRDNDPTEHGEIMAIKDACASIGNFDLSGCELYTTAYPCPMCACAIMWANIEKVYYGCNQLDTADIGFRDDDFYKRFEQGKANEGITELSRKDCLKLFEEYKKLNMSRY